MFPEDRAHQRGDNKGRWSISWHAPSGRGSTPPREVSPEEPPGHTYSFSASNDVPARTASPGRGPIPRASGTTRGHRNPPARRTRTGRSRPSPRRSGDFRYSGGRTPPPLPERDRVRRAGDQQDGALPFRSASARTRTASSRRQKRTRIDGGTASSITERKKGFPARSSLATIRESADVWGTHVSTTCPWINRQSIRRAPGHPAISPPSFRPSSSACLPGS